MSNEKTQPSWPGDALEGAKLTMMAVDALISGQSAVAYLKPTLEGFKLMAAELLKDSEALAEGAYSRSQAKIDRSPISVFFRQHPGDGGLSNGLVPCKCPEPTRVLLAEGAYCVNCGASRPHECPSEERP